MRRYLLSPRPPARAIRVELPTLALGVAIYTGWFLLTLFHHHLPLLVVFCLGGWLLAWHSSFQHEAVHGHPTSSRRFNALFAGIPLSLWLPFGVYRRTHLLHHGVRRLTDPNRDPESFYVTAAQWRRLSAVGRALLRAESTLLGRLVLGPFRTVFCLLAAEARSRFVRTWSLHLVAVLPVGYWVTQVCDIPLWAYLLCYVYPGLSLTLLRSFVEHRPTAEAAGADVALSGSAIVEAEPPLAWLFLFNNLHALHHEEPNLPWYALPGRYRQRRASLHLRNGGYVFRGYRAVAARYLLRPKDHPVHP